MPDSADAITRPEASPERAFYILLAQACPRLAVERLERAGPAEALSIPPAALDILTKNAGLGVRMRTLMALSRAARGGPGCGKNYAPESRPE